MTEEQVFLAALDLPDATARGAYLDEACSEDAGLRGKVEALLAAHDKSGEFLDVPAPEQISVEPSFSHAVTMQSDIMSAQKDPDDESDQLDFLAPPTRPDSIGRLGHYEVLQVLGKGGFGIVLRAFDDILQRVVAVKVMAPQMAATSPARKRFLREARTSAQVRHENVVQVYEVGEQPLPHLVMEFIPGETLQQRLDRVGPLDVPESLRIGRQIAEGLAAAHAMDLIHRDIKPGNVLLEGGQHKVKITDFGLARAADDASMTQSGQIAGTPMYMAPEQALGETLDQRADLFSLGSVLYQMVAGRAPFRANTAVAVLKRVAEDTPRNIREVIPETPQWLCDIIAKLHAKNPDDRFQSAREVADVLADCEAQLKANSRLQDFSRIPRGKSAFSAVLKWVAAAALLLPVLALAATEFAGVTHLFRGQQATTDPIKPGSEPVANATAAGKEWPNDVPPPALVKAPAAPADPVKIWSEAPHNAFTDLIRFEDRWYCCFREGIEMGGDPGSIRILVSKDAKSWKSAAVLRTDNVDLRDAHLSITPDKRLMLNSAAVVPATGSQPADHYSWVSFSNNGSDWSKPQRILGSWEWLWRVTWHKGDAYGVAYSWDPKAKPREYAANLYRSKDGITYEKVTRFENRNASEATVAFDGDVMVCLQRRDIGPITALFGRSEAPYTQWNWKDLGVFVGGPNLIQDPRGTWWAAGRLMDGGERTAVCRLDTKSGTLDVVRILTSSKGTYSTGYPGLVWYQDKLWISYYSSHEGQACIYLATHPNEPLGRNGLSDEEVKRIAALPAAEQVEEVRKELMRRNSGFDGTMQHKIENGVVTELQLFTDHVTDIAPIRVFKALQALDCSGTLVNGKGYAQLADLSPLTGMNLVGLRMLNLNWTQVGNAGLVHFKDCKYLGFLGLDSTQVTDAGLAYFKDCTSLRYLALSRTKVSDAGLAHFQDCKKLTQLHLAGTPVSDAGLGYFKECENLTVLGLHFTLVTDAGLAHFKNCKKLDNLNLRGTPVTNAGLALLKDCKELTRLDIAQTKVADLSLLKEMPLKELDCNFRPERDAEILRSIKTLEKINGNPATEFWKEMDVGKTSFAPFTDADVRRIAALPAAEQVEEVGKELMKRNPGFDGKVTHKIEGDVVTGLSFVPVKGQDAVIDLSPVRAAEFWERYDKGEFTN